MRTVTTVRWSTDTTSFDTKGTAVKCGNTKEHGPTPVWHISAEAVRQCYDLSRQEELMQVEYNEDDDSERAYLVHLENKTELGSWWGYGE